MTFLELELEHREVPLEIILPSTDKKRAIGSFWGEKEP